MIKYLPLILPIAYGLLAYLFSAWRTSKVLAAQSRPLEDAEIARLTRKMAAALDLPKITVSIYEIEPVNGLAAPDGQIYLTRGFYQKFRAGHVSAEELASVIAHELGHVALGHTRRRMIDFTGQNAVFVSLVALILRAIPVVGPLLAMFAARMVTGMIAARMSRRDEFEADAWASALLLKSGIGAEPQIALFEKLAALTGNRAGDVPAWLLSHPRPDERIAAIRANLARWNLPAA